MILLSHIIGIFLSILDVSLHLQSQSATKLRFAADLFGHRVLLTNLITPAFLNAMWAYYGPVVESPRFSHIIPVIKSLNWLKVKQRIEHKLLSVTFKVFTTSQPTYLFKLVSVQSSHSTQSSSAVTISRSFTSPSLKITNRSFRHAAPRFWNKLHSFREPYPHHGRSHSHYPTQVESTLSSPTLSPSITPSLFHSRHKTHLFLESFPL